MVTRDGGFGVPGAGTILEDAPREILWGGDNSKGLAYYTNGVIEGATRDANNTPTTDLRVGLVLGKLDSNGFYTDYDPDAQDGSEIAAGILANDIRAIDFDGTDADRHIRVLVGGLVRASQLLGLDDQARTQLGPRFVFDDDLIGAHNFLGLPWKNEEVTGDTTLTAADSGKRIVCTTADCDITLPAIATSQGFAVEVLRASDHEIAIISAEGDNIIVGNDLSADSVTFTTAGEQIGVRFKIEHMHVGTTPKWLLTYFEPVLGVNLGTVTYAIAT